MRGENFPATSFVSSSRANYFEGPSSPRGILQRLRENQRNGDERATEKNSDMKRRQRTGQGAVHCGAADKRRQIKCRTGGLGEFSARGKFLAISVFSSSRANTETKFNDCGKIQETGTRGPSRNIQG